MVESIKATSLPFLNQLAEAEAVRRGVPPEKHKDQILLSAFSPSNFSYKTSGNTFEVKFARNSPLNGQSYQDEHGQNHTLENCSSSSGDRTNEHVLSMRGIYKNGKLVCATGRPDTLLRGLEQSAFVPYGETFVVQSLMSPLSLTSVGGFDEKASTEAQAHTLNKLPHKPFFFIRPINLFSLLERILPKSLTGRFFADKISKESHNGFKNYFYSMGNVFSETEKKCIEDCFYFLEKEDLLPEEEILLRDLLCKFMGLPIIYHCKSSTDRTTVATNISCILAGWSKPFPKINGRFAPHLITQDPEFKAEFAEHSKANLPITQLSRGMIGFSWGKGLGSNPTAVRLLPDHMTRPVKQYVKRFILSFLLYFISMPFNILSLPFSSNKRSVLNKIFNPYCAWKALSSREIDPDSQLLKSTH